MFFLVTGASGMGKSTIRERIQDHVRGFADVSELADVAGTPEWSLRWRHQAVDRVVIRALSAQEAGRDYLLCGDPVPPGEVLAAPSALDLEGMVVCLLDASAEVQEARLRGRGDDPHLIPHHLAFANWMRRHVTDPTHLLDVISEEGWEEMRWERCREHDRQEAPWDWHLIDTSDLAPDAVAGEVLNWILGARRRQAQPGRRWMAGGFP